MTQTYGHAYRTATGRNIQNAPHLVLQVMSQQGVSLVRVFCFNDGYSLTNTPIQSSPGVYKMRLPWSVLT